MYQNQFNEHWKKPKRLQNLRKQTQTQLQRNHGTWRLSQDACVLCVCSVCVCDRERIVLTRSSRKEGVWMGFGGLCSWHRPTPRPTQCWWWTSDPCCAASSPWRRSIHCSLLPRFPLCFSSASASLLLYFSASLLTPLFFLFSLLLCSDVFFAYICSKK